MSAVPISVACGQIVVLNDRFAIVPGTIVRQNCGPNEAVELAAGEHIDLMCRDMDAEAMARIRALAIEQQEGNHKRHQGSRHTFVENMLPVRYPAMHDAQTIVHVLCTVPVVAENRTSKTGVRVLHVVELFGSDSNDFYPDETLPVYHGKSERHRVFAKWAVEALGIR